MQLHHERELDAPIDRVWARAKDVRTVAAAFPGGEITSTDGDTFTGRVTVAVGPVRLRYDGEGRLTGVDEDAHRATILAHGRQHRGPAQADIRITLALRPTGPGGTLAVLDTVLTVNGSALPLAGPLGERVAAPLVEEFLDRLAAEEHPHESGPSDLVGSWLRRLGTHRG